MLRNIYAFTSVIVKDVKKRGEEEGRKGKGVYKVHITIINAGGRKTMDYS